MIDRRALLARHSPRARRLHPDAPLSVGNGEFAVSVDATGLQTFPDAYSLATDGGAGTLLGTQSQWGWHTTPGPDGVTLEPNTVDYRVGDRAVPYVDLPDASPGGEAANPADAWRRENPHRLHLGLVGLLVPGGASVTDLSALDQHLDLATGTITSRFTLHGATYVVTSAVHPRWDALAVRIARTRVGGEADADADAGADAAPLGVRLRFPYGSGDWSDPADWSDPSRHRTLVSTDDAGRTVINRQLDETRYRVTVTGARDLRAVQRTHDCPHDVTLAVDGDHFEAVLHFQPGDEPSPALTVDAVLTASAEHWHGFWHDGGVVDLSAVEDERAPELERRIVLSQYLTAINCAGSLPPAETGLMTNSWRGKFHLEMHWWHAAHFPQWGRPALLERSLGWYERTLPRARATAERQGYAGARWPKQVGPEGVETPSNIGPFLLWQQPHPIYLAELIRRVDPTALDRYTELVDATADFMADVVVERDGRFHLDAPIIPAQESYTATRATNADPTFELAYWRWALLTAARWRALRGASAPESWMRVAENIAPPATRNGTYLGQRVEPTLFRDDHPSHLAALGVVPDTGLIDHAVMTATLDNVLADWHWPSTWGWDYPVMAMTAARLGRPNDAVDALLLDAPKNHYRFNGHNAQTAALPIYLPGNGGLLAAVGLMAAGWDGAPDRPAPGFPEGWPVRVEGVLPMP